MVRLLKWVSDIFGWWRPLKKRSSFLSQFFAKFPHMPLDGERFVLVTRRVKGNSLVWNGILLPKEVGFILDHYPLMDCRAISLDSGDIKQVVVRKVLTELKGHENERGLLLVRGRFPLPVEPHDLYDVYYFVFIKRWGRKMGAELWICIEKVETV